MNIIKKIWNLPYEERIVYILRFTLVFNLLLAIAKMILSYYLGFLLFVSGIFNIFILVSKFECFRGASNMGHKSFNYHNTVTGMFMVLGGIQYTIYNSLKLFNPSTFKYNLFIAICIAFVSFLELVIAIIGMIRARGKGHYFRNLKTINLVQALVSIVLTEVAITSALNSTEFYQFNSIFAFAMGLLAILVGSYIFIAPKVSIVDQKDRTYVKINPDSSDLSYPLNISLSSSKIYSNFYYEADLVNGEVVGSIKETESPWKNLKIGFKILLIILSEILIFPYGVGAFIKHFDGPKVIKNLDQIMFDKGYELKK